MKTKELITVRIWPQNLDWMSDYLMRGERSDFIRNAINDAIRPFGKHVVDMPFTPGRILQALGKT